MSKQKIIINHHLLAHMEALGHVLKVNDLTAVWTPRARGTPTLIFKLEVNMCALSGRKEGIERPLTRIWKESCMHNIPV